MEAFATNRMMSQAFAWSGFVLSAGFILSKRVTLPEFCWSFWLSGLFYSWMFVICGSVRTLFLPLSETNRIVSSIPFMRNWCRRWKKILICICGILCGGMLFYLYCWLFGFYGVFLSVFARMEPYEYFGENGFINSDFFTPVFILLGHYWPIVIGTLLNGLQDIFTENPWGLLVKPFNTRLVMIHVMVLGVPVFSLLAWYFVGGAYQPIVIGILLMIFTHFFQKPLSVSGNCPSTN